MEEKVYLCSWKRTPAGFELWVKSRPKFRAAGASYAEAEERLIATIQDSGGAMVPIFEFDPPLPKSAWEAKYCSPELFIIGGDDRFETDAPNRRPFESKADLESRFKWRDEFFQSPICRKCGYESSPRSNKALTLTYVPSVIDGAFGSVAGAFIHIYSEDFLKLLTPKERKLLQFRPVICKSRRKFYELIGPEGPPLVGVKGLKPGGWHCTKCGYRTWGYWIDGLAIHDFVAQSDLPKTLSGLFTIGTFPEIELVATVARWKQLVGKKGSRGFTSRNVGVVPEREVVRSPKLPSRKKS